MSNKITIIGSGNIATWFADAIHRHGGSISQIYSRNIEHAKKLADLYQSEAISDLSLLHQESDLYLFALNDQSYLAVLKMIPFKMRLAVHTGGSISKNIFSEYAEHYGVIYPYQSISKDIDFSKVKVPLCVEGSDQATLEQLIGIAKQWSDIVHIIDEEQRAGLHLAAVFACNFVNALYGIGHNILIKQDIDPTIILPLLQNTLDKIKITTPAQAQTGPAIRNETDTMNKHLERLADSDLRDIYKKISHIIQKENH